MAHTTPYNFLGLPGEFTSPEKSKIIILPVPFDETGTWIRGADRGPDAIIEASRHLELYDRETDSEVYRQGIHTEKPLVVKGSENMVSGVYSKIRELLGKGKFVVTVGGEHSVAIGAVKAHNELYQNTAVLSLDAHADLRDEYEGDRYNHACAIARIREIVGSVVSAGVRSMDISERGRVDEKLTFFADYIHGSRTWIDEIIQALPESVYVSIDLDVFDPGIMPSTGTPEPGGLDWYQVTNLLRAVSRHKKIAGCDFTELCPTSGKAPDFLAAKLIYKLLSYRFS